MSKIKQDLVALYKQYNKSLLNYDHLVCMVCSAWLTKPIFLIGNGHVCKGCSTRSGKKYMRNTALERLLKGGKYPCKFNNLGCKVYEELIQNHEERCDHNRRCYCGQLVGDQNNLIEHIKEKHSMVNYLLEKPVFEQSLFPPQDSATKFETHPPFYLHAGATKLISRISLITEGTFYKIGFHVYDAGEITRNIKYLIKITYDETEYTKNGTVSKSFFNNDDLTMAKINNISENDGSEIKYKIYFDNYQNFEPFEKHFVAMLKDYECPICMESVEDNCYQCKNGHNLCNDCKKKISSCPSCRLPINVQGVNLRSALAHIIKLCKYLPNGCFMHGYINDIQKHEIICPMKLKYCNVCIEQTKENQFANKTFDKADFFNHMLKEHEMQIFQGSHMVVKPGFIAWMGCVFKFEFTISDYIVNPSCIHSSCRPKITQRQIRWFVRLLDGQKASDFYSYKLEIEIYGRIITVNGIVQDDENLETLFYPQMDKSETPKLQLSFAVTDELKNYTLFSRPDLLLSKSETYVAPESSDHEASSRIDSIRRTFQYQEANNSDDASNVASGVVNRYVNFKRGQWVVQQFE